MWTDEEDLGESNMSVDTTEPEIDHRQSGLSPLPVGFDFYNVFGQQSSNNKFNQELFIMLLDVATLSSYLIFLFFKSKKYLFDLYP